MWNGLRNDSSFCIAKVLHGNMALVARYRHTLGVFGLLRQDRDRERALSWELTISGLEFLPLRHI